MFPNDLQVQVQQAELQRAARQWDLVRIATEDANRLSVWQRIRVRLSVSTPVAAALPVRAPVGAQTEAIA